MPTGLGVIGCLAEAAHPVAWPAPVVAGGECLDRGGGRCHRGGVCVGVRPAGQVGAVWPDAVPGGGTGARAIRLGPGQLGPRPRADPGPVGLTLGLVLFTDAAAVPFQALRRAHVVPIRLLAVGLPLTIGLGWLLGWPLLPGLSGWEL